MGEWLNDKAPDCKSEVGVYRVGLIPTLPTKL